MADLTYQVRNGEFHITEIENGCKVDGHVHSRYSGIKPTAFIGAGITRLVGVRESYSRPKKIYRLMKESGMRFCPLQDHNSVFGALELRKKYPDDVFVNCEYSVAVDPEHNKFQAIHVGVWGLDYAHGVKKAASDNEVLELNKHLSGTASKGYLKFIEECEEVDLPYVWNHILWQGTPKQPLSGSQLDELVDAFPILEINGEHQLENLLTTFIAMERRKLLCAGTDAHMYRRIGKHYTTTFRPVETPYEYLQAFKDGEIAIGSLDPPPDSVLEHINESCSIEKASLIEEIMRSQFNGTYLDMVKDTNEGIWHYFAHEWRTPRKYLTMAALLTLHSLAAMLYPEVALPTLVGVEAAAAYLCSATIPLSEKMDTEARAKLLYDDYLEHLFLRETEKDRRRIAELMVEVEMHEEKVAEVRKKRSIRYPHFRKKGGLKFWFLNKLRRFDFMRPDYDISKVLDYEDKQEKE